MVKNHSRRTQGKIRSEDQVVSPLLIVGLILLAFNLRLFFSHLLPWREDEIVYVDWIGSWFADHFWTYLFQWHHTTYPPQSPYFANPPLAMWLMALGIKTASWLNFSTLYGARLINITLGTLTTYLTYRFAKQFFSQKVALASFLILAILPSIVVNNASAFLDTLLGLLLLLALWLLFLLFGKATWKRVTLSSIVVGLLLLTKLSLVAVVLLLITATIFSLAKQRRWREMLIYILLVNAVPYLSWSGYRDLNHIRGVIDFLSQKLAIYYHWPADQIRYELFILKDLPLALIIGLLFGLLFAGYCWFSKRRTQEVRLISFLAFTIVIGLIELSVIAPASFSYQLLPLTPFMVIVGLWGIERLWLTKRLWPLSLALIVSCLGELLFLSFATPFRYYGLAETPIARLIGLSNNLIPLGTGSEGLAETGKLMQSDLPARARIGALYTDWTLKKYVGTNQTVIPWFPNESLTDLISRGVEYAVYSPHYMPPTSQALLSLRPYQPIKKIVWRNETLALIYAVPQDAAVIAKIPLNQTWQQLTQNVTIGQFFQTEDLLKLRANFKNDPTLPQFVSVIGSQLQTVPASANAFQLSLLGTGRTKNFYLDWLDNASGNYRRAEVRVDWQGERVITLPFTDFKPVNLNPSQPVPTFSSRAVIKCSIDSPEGVDIDLQIKNLNYARYLSESTANDL